MYDRQALIELVRDRALQLGDFTLASGKKSNYFLDAKQVILYSQGLRLVSEGLLEMLEGVEFDAIGGTSIGADPIVGGVITVAAEQGRDLDGFLVRKQIKDHGTKKAIEGPLEPGSKVVIVDDVFTTGGSALIAVDRAIEHGCEIVQVVGIVDRLQGATETFAERSLPFECLLTIRDLQIEPAPSNS